MDRKESWKLAAALIAAIVSTAPAVAGESPVSVFDGKTLAGWQILPGGTWQVKDGMIVGASPKSEPRHGLLLSDKKYRDFDVCLKFRVIKGNSGFYFRSEKVAGAVGVHGFQAEVDNSNSVGGLYETGGRAWVAQPPAELIRKIYKPGEWTELRVVARDRDVTVYLNGTKTAELVNDRGRLEGHFALQLHGGMDMDVMFKDIQIRELPTQTAK